jgi:hypothetical protein
LCEKHWTHLEVKFDEGRHSQITYDCGHAAQAVKEAAMERTLHLAVQVSDPTAHPLMPGRSGLVGIVVMFLAIALICRGSLPLVRFRRWRAHAAAAHARIVGNVPDASHRRISWLPVVEFQVAGVTVMSSIASAANRRRSPVGQIVDVLYNPRDPQQTELADTRLTTPASLIIGVCMLVTFFVFVAL